MFDGSKIKQLRVKMNLNQAELADRLGCSQANISQYENNKTKPDLDIIISMAKLFNKSVDYILGIDNLDTDSLDENEQFIINTYRGLRPETKVEFLGTVKMVKTLREIQKKNLG